jgi:YVTN family beta-propeller protein
MDRTRITAICLITIGIAMAVAIVACDSGGKASRSTTPSQAALASADTNKGEAAQESTVGSWTEVPLESDVIDLDLDPISGHLYVLSSDAILILDSDNGESLRTLPLALPEWLPHRIAVSPESGLIYATVESMAAGEVVVLDSESGEVLAEIGDDYVDVGGVAVDVERNRVYAAVETADASGVSVEYERALIVIDGISNQVIATIPGIGDRPGEVAVNMDTGLVYVSDIETDAVYVIDIETDSVLTKVTVPDAPYDLRVNEDTNRVYVLNGAGRGSVSVIDGASNQVVDTLELENGACGISVDPNDEQTYVMSIGYLVEREADIARVVNAENKSVVVDYEELLSCQHFTVDSERHHAYTIDSTEDHETWFLNILDFSPKAAGQSVDLREMTPTAPSSDARFRLIAEVPVGGGPIDVAVNEKTGKVFVANRDSRELSIIDGEFNEVVATIPLAAAPTFVAVNPNTNHVYVNDEYGVTAVFDGESGTRLTSIPLAYGFDGVVNTVSNRLYLVFNNGSNSDIVVIDGTTDTLLASVPVGEGIRSVGVDDTSDRIYIADEYGGSVIVVDGATNSIVDEIALPEFSSPRAIAVDGESKRAYVEGAGGITVIDLSTDTVLTTLDRMVSPSADVTDMALANMGSIVIDERRGLLFVTSWGGILVIDKESYQVTSIIPLEDVPIPDRLTINANTGHLYFVDEVNNVLRVVG